MLKSGLHLFNAPTGTGKSKLIIEELFKPHYKNENHGFGTGNYQEKTDENIGIGLFIFF